MAYGNTRQLRTSRSTRGGGATAGFRGGRGRPGYPVPDRLREQEQHTGTFFALSIPSEVAKALAIEGGEPPEKLHVTLFYQNDMSPEMRKKAADIARELSDELPIDASIAGVGRFSASESSDGKDVFYASVDSPELTDLRRRLSLRLAEIGIDPDMTHGYTPHITLKYIDRDEPQPRMRINPVKTKLGSMIVKESRTRRPVRATYPVPKSIPHLEDLSHAEIGRFLVGLAEGRVEVTEKVDGSCMLTFGVREGRLWTSTKSGPAAMSATEHRNEAARAAHRALEARDIGRWMHARGLVEEDTVFLAEVLHGPIPNSVEYRSDTIVINGILTTGGVLPARQGHGMSRSMVSSTGGSNVAGWTLRYANDVTESVSTDVAPETFRLREGRTTEAWDRVRPRLMRRISIMESAFGPAGVEGIVLREGDRYAKVVDREHFTRVNKFFWEWRERLEKGMDEGSGWKHGVFRKLRHDLAEAVGSKSLRSDAFAGYLMRNFAGGSVRETIERFCRQPGLFPEGYMDAVSAGVAAAADRLSELRSAWEAAKSSGPSLRVEGNEWRPARTVRMPSAVVERTDGAFADAERRMAVMRRSLSFTSCLPDGTVRQARTITMAMGPRMLEGLERALRERSPDVPSSAVGQKASPASRSMANARSLVKIGNENISSLRRRGIEPKDKILGAGSYGIALEVDYKGKPAALKLTTDPHEARTSNHLKGKSLKSTANIYDVFRFKSDKEAYGIVMEKVSPVSAAEAEDIGMLHDIINLTNAAGPMAAGRFKALKPLRKHVIGAVAHHGMSDNVVKVFDEVAELIGLDEKLRELGKHGVGFADIHSGNVMKRGGDFVFIDLGWGSQSGGAEPDMLETYKRLRKVYGLDEAGTAFHPVREKKPETTISERKAGTIGLTIGRFQPFHRGHAALVRRLTSQYDKVVIVVAGNESRDSRNPFSYQTRLEMINRSLPDVMSKVEVFKSDGPGAGYLPDVVSKIAAKSDDEDSVIENDTALNVLVGRDRADEFRAQFDRARERGFDTPVVVKPLDDVRGDDVGKFSATAVRSAIAKNDRKSFEKMVDPHIVSDETNLTILWDKLRDELKDVGPVKEKLEEAIGDIGGLDGINDIVKTNGSLLVKRKGIRNMQFLGRGMEGAAFDIGGGRVLKVTADRQEAVSSNILKERGANLPNVVKIFDVFRFKDVQGRGPAYGIITERLTELSDAEKAEFDRLTSVIDTEKAKKDPYWDAVAYEGYNGSYMDFMKALGDLLEHEKMKDLGIASDDGKTPPPGQRPASSAASTKPTAVSVSPSATKPAAPTKPASGVNRASKPTTGAGRPGEDLVDRAKREAKKELERYDAGFRKYQIDKMFSQLRSVGINFLDFHSGNLMKRGSTYVINDIGRSRARGGSEPPVLESIADAVIEVLGGSHSTGGAMYGAPGSNSGRGIRAGSSGWSGAYGNMTDDDEEGQGWWQSQLTRLRPIGKNADDNDASGSKREG